MRGRRRPETDPADWVAVPYVCAAGLLTLALTGGDPLLGMIVFPAILAAGLPFAGVAAAIVIILADRRARQHALRARSSSRASL